MQSQKNTKKKVNPEAQKGNNVILWQKKDGNSDFLLMIIDDLYLKLLRGKTAHFDIRWKYFDDFFKKVSLCQIKYDEKRNKGLDNRIR